MRSIFFETVKRPRIPWLRIPRPNDNFSNNCPLRRVCKNSIILFVNVFYKNIEFHGSLQNIHNFVLKTSVNNNLIKNMAFVYLFCSLNK